MMMMNRARLTPLNTPGRAHEAVHVGDEGGGRNEVTEHLRDCFYEDHDDDQELLGSLVDRFVVVVGQIKPDDLGADEQLHDDRPVTIGPMPEMHQGALGTGQDGPVGAEDIDDVRPGLDHRGTRWS